VVTVDVAAKVADLWQRLEAFAAGRGGPSLDLRPPATEKDIAAAEQAMKLRFPPGFRASLRLHDGQAGFGIKDARSFPWMPGCPPLAPLDAIVERWTAVQALAGKRRPSDELTAADRIKAGAHRTGRIPIAGAPRWTGDAVYLDLDPGRAGAAGQLIASVADALVVVDASFEAALARWLFVLERGLWTYDPARHLAFPTGRDALAASATGLFSRR
ncbi:MAG TPA: SMI1/KNR4 family protein, partial [Kofleriaceae bacterium]|nr:SMI1/KNR4 family protein [Kofleriaceae bacterium]